MYSLGQKMIINRNYLADTLRAKEQTRYLCFGHMRLMMGQKVTELKNGNQSNQL